MLFSDCSNPGAVISVEATIEALSALDVKMYVDCSKPPGTESYKGYTEELSIHEDCSILGLEFNKGGHMSVVRMYRRQVVHLVLISTHPLPGSFL